MLCEHTANFLLRVVVLLLDKIRLGIERRQQIDDKRSARLPIV